MRLIDADTLMEAMYHRTFETDGDTMWQSGCWVRYKAIEQTIKAQPTIEQPEPLTDKEQRIFLAAIGREEKVCEEVDRNYVREPYEDSLIRVCKEIRRKVKGALWMT